MVVTNEDRYTALEEKLRQAESALFGCRAMLNYVRRLEYDDTKVADADGLYPGQLADPNQMNCETEAVEEECVE